MDRRVVPCLEVLGFGVLWSRPECKTSERVEYSKWNGMLGFERTCE